MKDQAGVTYIVLVNWNGWQHTLECLESLFQLRDVAFRIVVCDNGSNDDSLSRLKAWALGQQPAPASAHPFRCCVPKPVAFDLLDATDIERPTSAKLIFIDCQANLGFAGGCNVGIRHALAQEDMSHVWLLNNDTVVCSDTLLHLLDKSRKTPQAGMIGSTVVYYHQPSRVQAFGGARYFPCIGVAMHIGRIFSRLRAVDEDAIAARMDYVLGASMLVTRRYIEHVGLMSEDYFLYYEELDWALRGKGHYSLGYASRSLVYHKGGVSIGSSSDPRWRSVKSDSYLIDNRLVVTRRFFPECLWSVRLFLVFEVAIRLLRGRMDQARMVWHRLSKPLR